jgi:SMI1 / KNR4 family (SUKH-1)
MNEYTIKAQIFERRFKKLFTGKYAWKLTEICGFSEEEVEAVEKKYDLSLPVSYKVFLVYFGNVPKSFLLDFDMGDEHPLEMTEFFYDRLTMKEGEYIPPIDVPPNMFAFASYLYEHFYFFFLDDPSDDPAIYLANTFQGGGKPFEFKKVGKSVWDFLEEGITNHENRKA